MEKLPVWDLSDLYESIDSLDIQDDLDASSDIIKDLNEKYKGNIEKISGDELYDLLAKAEIAEELLSKTITYAYLNYAININKEKYTFFYQDIAEKATKISTGLLFPTLEINLLSDENLQQKLSESEKLRRYKPYIRDVRRFKDHQLSEELEKLFVEKGGLTKKRELFPGLLLM